MFDDVDVPTYEKKIKEISENFGTSMPFLTRAKNSDNFVTTFGVIDGVSFLRII